MDKLAGCCIDKIFEHPAGDGRIKHHEQKIAGEG
jgi:hypothetical protein